MKHLLLCPSERPAVSLLGSDAPLAAVPLLGQSLLEYWLSSLAGSGVKQLMVSAHDRPEHIKRIVGDGSRWGLDLKLLPETRELGPAQALLKYANELEGRDQGAITVLDHFPGMPGQPLFDSYKGLFSALLAWLPRAQTPDRVGVKEIKPGVWVGSHSVISPKARLIGPCWVGRHVYVGARAVIGPNVILENGSYIEAHAEIAESCVGAGTFVGKLARVAGSFAWGSTLLDWRLNVASEVPDPFLMCALRHQGEGKAARWLARVSQLYSRNKEEAGVLWKHLLLNREG